CASQYIESSSPRFGHASAAWAAGAIAQSRGNIDSRCRVFIGVSSSWRGFSSERSTSGWPQNSNTDGAPAHTVCRDLAGSETAVAYHHRPLREHFVASELNVVVLAAGLGKRMHSALPKVLHRLAGRPLLFYVIDSARALSPRAITVVVGHGAEAVQKTLAAPDLAFVLQDPPLGTGDATRIALDVLPQDGVTLVTIGDIPLVPPEALATLVQEAEAGHLAVLTARVPDPTGLGRIVRDAAGRVRAIIEERDVNELQRAINEINTGVMAAPTALLRRWVAQLKPDNAQNEYYVTDIVATSVSDGIPVVAHVAGDERDVRGINDRAQLIAVERIVQERRIAALMTKGVAISDPARLEIRGTL